MQRISEVIEIIEKTGDKCIILKDNGAFVLMKFEDYKRLLNASQPLKTPPRFNPDIKEFEVAAEDRYYPEPDED